MDANTHVFKSDAFKPYLGDSRRPRGCQGALPTVRRPHGGAVGIGPPRGPPGPQRRLPGRPPGTRRSNMPVGAHGHRTGGIGFVGHPATTNMQSCRCLL